MKTGTDVVENSRFVEAITRNHGRLRERLFTSDELAYSPDDLELALMFSAKESVAKALGTGFDSSLSWHHIRIYLDGSNLNVQLSGRARELAGERKLFVSATQNKNTSVTFALLTEGE